MESAFANIEKEGKNDAESLIKWMKESKVIDQTKEEEEKVRKLFADAAGSNKVSLDQFKDVMQKVSDDSKKNLEGLMKQLGDTGPKLLQDLTQGASDAASSMKGAVDGLMKGLGK